MTSSIKRVLVATDLTEMDDQLLSYISQLSRQIKFEKLYIAHIIPNILVPANAELAFHKMFSSGFPLTEKVRNVLADKSEQYFGESDFEIDFEVVEGNAYQKLLNLISLKEIDLLVLGNKSQSEGSGITAKRIARKVGCHVLFVPEKLPAQIENILVPVDFSENSARALKMALRLKEKNTKITALNTIRMLHADYYSGMSVNSYFRESIMENAWNSFGEFQVKYGLDEEAFEQEAVINEYDNVASQLKDYLHKAPFELIVMGAKGHTVLENFLMGSVTESLVSSFAKLPILIIR